MPDDPSPADLSGRRELVGPDQASAASSLHDMLWLAAITRPLDYEPYGLRIRETTSDCSCGCRHFMPLEGETGMDWGVCKNPKSHRCGLLTFEHMGCPQFEYDAEAESHDL